MFKMTAAALGLCFIILSVSAQVRSQASTQSTGTTPKSTVSGNVTTVSYVNSTSPAGAGSSLRCGASSLLLPFAAAISVLRGRS